MKELKMAQPQNSKHVVFCFENRHPNIEILAHPNIPVFFWSHHEKLIIVDQSIAFMGGLDLCYGRYEWPGYHVVDYFLDKETEVYHGQDYNNVRIKDFDNLENYDTCLIDKNKDPQTQSYLNYRSN